MLKPKLARPSFAFRTILSDRRDMASRARIDFPDISGTKISKKVYKVALRVVK